jgi:phosphoglycolate phosphatase
MKYTAVLFDFDYTLADSSAGVIDCVTFAFRQMGLADPAPERICATIGLSLGETFTGLAGGSSPADIVRFRTLFLQRAEVVMVDRTQMFEAVGPVAAQLIGAGLRLGIVSTKFRYRIEQILGREGLLDAFSVIVGGEEVPQGKPDPAGLWQALAVLGVRPSEAVYVGDSEVDGETARRAGVDFLAVLSGPTSAEVLSGYAPVALLPGVGSLPQALGVAENGVP